MLNHKMDPIWAAKIVEYADADTYKISRKFFWKRFGRTFKHRRAALNGARVCVYMEEVSETVVIQSF